MKAYFIGLVIMGGCLLYGCQTKQKKGENLAEKPSHSGEGYAMITKK